MVPYIEQQPMDACVALCQYSIDRGGCGRGDKARWRLGGRE